MFNGLEFVSILRFLGYYSIVFFFWGLEATFHILFFFLRGVVQRRWKISVLAFSGICVVV